MDDGSIFRINFTLAGNDSFCYWQVDDKPNTSTVTNFAGWAGEDKKVVANFASCASQTANTTQGVVTVLNGTISRSNDAYIISANNHIRDHFSYWLTNNQFVNSDTCFDHTFQINAPSSAVVYKPVYDKVVGFVSFFSTYQNVNYSSWNAFDSHKSDFYGYAYYYFDGSNNVNTNMTITNGVNCYKKFDNIPNQCYYFWGTIYAFDNGTTFIKMTPSDLDYGFGRNYALTINGRSVYFQIER